MEKRPYMTPSIEFTEVTVERGFAESAGDVTFENGYDDDFEDTYALGSTGRNSY